MRVRSHRVLAVALGGLLVMVAACGSDSDDTSSSEPEASTAAETTVRSSAATTAQATTTPPPDETVADTSDSGETVEVSDVLGTREVPVTDDGLFALDEYTGLTLLALGAPADEVNAFLGDGAAVAVLENAGVTVSQIGRAEPSVEAIAATRPEMIVGVGHPNSVNVADLLLEISPVVLTDFQRSWDEQMRVLAAATGTEGRAQELIDVIDAKAEQTAEAVRAAGMEGMTISIIVDYGGGQIVAFGPDTLAGTLVEQVGLVRPDAEGAEASAAQDASRGPFILVAEETLADHDADIVVGPVGTFAPASINENSLRDAGGEAVAAIPDADVWNANTPLAAYWILTDLERIVSGAADDTLTLDEVVTVWEELTR